MERITKEGKDVDLVLQKIMEENNISKEELLYTSTLKKSKLFQGNLYEVSVYLKTDLNKEVKRILTEIVQNMGLEVSIELSVKDDRPTLKMYSNKDYILIGKNGATLKAIEVLAKQFLLNETGLYYKFNVDVADYKEKMAKKLESLALKCAKDVVKTNIAVSLDNMSSYERRIVHNALADFSGIKTESEGEEPNRHIVIKPM